jgi:gamma-glutamyltranspeptidase
VFMARPSLSRVAVAVLVSLLPATRLALVDEERLLAHASNGAGPGAASASASSDTKDAIAIAKAIADADTLTPLQHGDTRAAAASPLTGARDPSWSPDGSLIAVSLIDQIWIMTRDGQSPRAVVTWDGTRAAIERDPVWSPDGRRIAFAADRGDGFDLYVVPVSGGSPERVTYLPGDERWPSWTGDGRIVFAHRAVDQWDLARVLPAIGTGVVSRPEPLTDTPFDETEPRVSPDGTRVLFVSNRDTDASETDLWLMPLDPPSSTIAPDATSVTPAANVLLAPDASKSETLKLAALKSDAAKSEAGKSDAAASKSEAAASPKPDASDTTQPVAATTAATSPEPASAAGMQAAPSPSMPSSTSPSSTSSSTSPSTSPSTAPASPGSSSPSAPSAPSRQRVVRVLRARGLESSPTWAPDGHRIAFSAIRGGAGSLWVMELELPGETQAARPAAPAQLMSRHGGQVAWSPDSRQLLVADTPDPDPIYNGNPRRDSGDAPPLFALGTGFHLRLLPAPRPPDEGESALSTRLVMPSTRWMSAFEEVWGTLKTLYYQDGPGADAWQALHDVYAPRAAAARDEASLEAVVDDLVAEQPLIKPQMTSRHAMVVSAHRLASEAGVRVLSRGGNVIDAAIAVSLVLGVVEPDASGLGGDGMAILYLKGMKQPTVIDFKDQTPIHATLDNPALLRDGRLVGDGAAAANIPGLLAGLDYLYQHYGSKRLRWEDLVAPAIRHADEGFVLDETLPTSLAEGQSLLRKYEASRTLFLPNGRVPRPGDRFVNHDLASTLRAVAAGGATEFYQGALARRIATDMAEHGGIIGYDDLAQYRAVEREPVSGRYRDHVVYSTPPPVSSGTSLVETLQILDHFKARGGATASKDADYLHYLIEASKIRHTLREVADPALWPVSIAQHLDYTHAGELFQLIDPKKAGRFRADADFRDDGGPNGPLTIPGSTTPSGAGASGAGSGTSGSTPNSASPNSPSAPGVPRADASGESRMPNVPTMDLRDTRDDDDHIGRGTTAFVVVDGEGNMIAVTQTLSTWGGSFYVSKGLGFLYNNHLRSSRTARGTVGQLLPLMRSSSTNTPTLVFRESNGVRTPRLAVGAAGNAWIVPSVYAVVTNILDGGLTAQSAVEAPRFLLARDPADPNGTQPRVQIEDRFSRPVLQELIHRGHTFQKIGRKGEVRYGYASAATIDAETHTVTGGADPRRSHAAVSWDGKAQ